MTMGCSNHAAWRFETRRGRHPCGREALKSMICGAVCASLAMAVTTTRLSNGLLAVRIDTPLGGGEAMVAGGTVVTFVAR
jgi:hypothetical protein